MDAIRILIVKLSSLGDIVQSFGALEAIRARLPNAKIDWVVAASFQELIKAHPLIDEAIVIDPSSWRSLLRSIHTLRKKKYHLLFDLQGNSKSAFFTFLACAKEKVGFSWKTAREWPNVLATNLRFTIEKNQNIVSFYQELISSYFQDEKKIVSQGVELKVEEKEKKRIETLFLHEKRKKILICLGSRWKSKKAPFATWQSLLKKILMKDPDSCFYFAWGTLEEKEECKALCDFFPKNSILLEKYSLPGLQYLMTKVDLMIGVDSIALHLCATTKTPTLALFGPTHPKVFAPLGKKHQFLLGRCPYGMVFDKQCPKLRGCLKPRCLEQDSFLPDGNNE